ncbi:MAG: M20/M25/M40 family metallo-hydrolase, partial [Clostridia bacterium]|nr:M20/M25/M40 family metallo-hydrolase [Clostridia bacterium]
MNNQMYFFKEICNIPHGSGNCRGIADYIVGFAEKRGLRYIRDNSDNVIVFKKAAKGRENDPAVMLQGHTDMVCEAEKGVDFDFLSDKIKLLEDGDIITADGTTLGADDGAAVALMLSLLDDSTLDAPSLECVFTTDEEVGMLGAIDIDLSECRAKYLINADSEEEGVFTCGCAGGICVDFSVPVTRETKCGDFVKVSVSGLLGGHSGTEINKGRLNAIKLLAGILSEDDRIVSIERDGKDNAIPARCDAVVYGDGEKIKERFSKIGDLGSEKEVKLEILPADKDTYEVLTEESQRRVLEFLREVPFGVRKMCEEPAGLVHTSDNMGIIKTFEDKICGTLS